MNIAGKDYAVIGILKIREDLSVPILDIPLMDDEKYRDKSRIARRQLNPENATGCTGTGTGSGQDPAS